MATRSSPSGSPAPGPARTGADGPDSGPRPVEQRRRARAGRSRRGGRAGARTVEFIYGKNSVREALRGRRSVRSVLVATGEGRKALERSLEDWCAETGSDVPSLRHVPGSELSALLGTDDHQGMAAEVEPYPYLELPAILDSHDLVVGLDQVQDPHNLGAIVRTAEASGAVVLIPRHRAAMVTAAVVKASAGATEHAAVARVRNLADALLQMKDAGFWIYGAAAGADALYSAQDYRQPTCFVVGSEGEGLGQRVTSLCDVMVRLPLTGRVNSLNVSVSTGVLLYEAIRQRATSTTRPQDC